MSDKSIDSRLLDAAIARYDHWFYDDEDETPLSEVVQDIVVAARNIQAFADEALELVQATIKEFKPAEVTEKTAQTIDLGKALDRAAVEGAVKRIAKGK